jgi:hypothetical protein
MAAARILPVELKRRIPTLISPESRSISSRLCVNHLGTTISAPFEKRRTKTLTPSAITIIVESTRKTRAGLRIFALYSSQKVGGGGSSFGDLDLLGATDSEAISCGKISQVMTAHRRVAQLKALVQFWVAHPCAFGLCKGGIVKRKRPGQ